MSEEKKPTIFDVLGPGKTFLAGFAAALLVFFTIGFFVMMAKCDCGSFGSGSKNTVFFGKVDAGQKELNDETAPDSGSQVDLAPITAEDHVRGDLNKAQAVIVEFSDYDCPFCQRFHPTMNQIMSDYEGQVAWVYRHFPLDSLHPNARTKAEASECVASLGGNEAFWEFTDALYDEARGTISVAQLEEIAAETGVSQAKFQECLDGGETEELVQEDYLDAVASGGRGTPHSIIMTRDGKTYPISGALPVSDIKAVLDPILQ